MNEAGQKLMERELAQKLRREWMTLMGCDADEITEHCESAECCNPSAEQEQLDAARRIASRNRAKA